MSRQRGSGGGAGGTFSVVRIPPYEYVHVLDTNTNVTRVICGPKTYTKQDHEQLVLGPEAMTIVPPRHYCIVTNPVVVGEDGEPERDQYGQFRLRFGDAEVRTVDVYPEPFPLYPGETLEGGVQPLRIVAPNTCLKLRALRPFHDDREDVDREAGDEWQFRGPGTYLPRIEVEEVELIESTLIRHNEAVCVRAVKRCKDIYGKMREAGERWLVRQQGAFLPGPYETVEGLVKAVVLTDKKALHLVASRDFTDVYGTTRKAGEEWLVVSSMATSHLVDVDESQVGIVALTTLNNRQYCVVVDPVVDGVQRRGTRQLRKGETSFFLQPGETLEDGIRAVEVLAEDEALLVTAREAFVDCDYVDSSEDGLQEAQDVQRRPGDRWMVYGPCDYIPSIVVDVLERRRAIPLDVNEGVYVRDNRTGAVSARIGRTYMLKPNETLWAKELPREVEDLVARNGRGSGERDRSRVVTYRVAHNCVCQVYDYKAKSSRVVFGPDLVMLAPDENFTIVRLSGSTPKVPNVVTTLALRLGPDFMTDVVTVETADHARLNLRLSYNWHFDVNEETEDVGRIFAVRDFVGDACKAIASRVRGAVAAENFDTFHKYSAKIIRSSVFGLTEDGHVQDQLVFEANSLIITNVDVQSVEPVDQRTLESLQKSVQLAIEITTQSLEAKAKHEAKREEALAMGRLERQKLTNEAEAEGQRRELLQLRAESAAVESQGQAKAEAAALADASRIRGEADVEQARLHAQAVRIENAAKLEQLKAQHAADIAYQRQVNELELARASELAEIEAGKFAQTVAAIGADTIASIARAGPEMQAKLLQGLGLQGFLVTDGNNPINLFQTASGMIGTPGMMGAGTGAGGAGARADDYSVRS